MRYPSLATSAEVSLLLSETSKGTVATTNKANHLLH